MNFVSDLTEIIEKRLKAEGIDYDDNLMKKDSVVFLANYIEFMTRRISLQRRKVKLSKELQSCQDYITYESVLKNLVTLSESGGDITPYQTKRLRGFNKQDRLLSDWGIHHLHLGELQSGKRFSDRTSALLYAIFLEQITYFIAIMDHNSFSDIELLRIIESNWPSYLKAFELEGIIDLEFAPSSKEVKILREAGVAAFIKLPSGRILGPPGGGITTAGTSVRCMMEAQRTARLLWNAEAVVKQNDSDFREKLGIAADAPIRLIALESTCVIISGEGASIHLKIPIIS